MTHSYNHSLTRIGAYTPASVHPRQRREYLFLCHDNSVPCIAVHVQHFTGACNHIAIEVRLAIEPQIDRSGFCVAHRIIIRAVSRPRDLVCGNGACITAGICKLLQKILHRERRQFFLRITTRRQIAGATIRTAQRRILRRDTDCQRRYQHNQHQ